MANIRSLCTSPSPTMLNNNPLTTLAKGDRNTLKSDQRVSTSAPASMPTGETCRRLVEEMGNSDEHQKVRSAITLFSSSCTVAQKTLATQELHKIMRSSRNDGERLKAARELARAARQELAQQAITVLRTLVQKEAAQGDIRYFAAEAIIVSTRAKKADAKIAMNTLRAIAMDKGVPSRYQFDAARLLLTHGSCEDRLSALRVIQWLTVDNSDDVRNDAKKALLTFFGLIVR